MNARQRNDSTSSEDEQSKVQEDDNFSTLLSSLPVTQNLESEDEIEEEETGDSDNMEVEEEEHMTESESSDNDDDDDEDEEVTTTAENNYIRNFQYDMSYSLFEAVSSTPIQQEASKKVYSSLGDILIEIPKSIANSNEKDDKIIQRGEKEIVKLEQDDLPTGNLVEKDILKNIQPVADKETPVALTALQLELISLQFSYKDLYFTQRSLDNADEIRKTYCIHALNHALKAQNLINSNSMKLSNSSEPNLADDDSFRDQGFVRPKVLILVPFRESAFKVVEMMKELFAKKEKPRILNYQRFVDEFTGSNLSFPKIKRKPEDYEKTFAGNTDDNFRIGISLKRNCIKLYTAFSSTDIILASPLGLRMLIETPDDNTIDFLSSIEILILDQLEVFLMQNWDHMLKIFDNLHLQPQSRGNTDYSRIRNPFINGWSKYYRQTLLFTSHDLPEFRSIFNNRCSNFRGRVRTETKVLKGSMHQVVFEVSQTFHRIDVKTNNADERFEYFVNSILPKFKSSTMAHCLIYVPSYFDFVRVRNYMKKENVNFTQISEYTKPDKISRARTLFYHGSTHFLLYSERAHFFHRFLIKGVRHVIFYQPPTISNFYSEIINSMQAINQNPNDNVMKCHSATVLYNKFDVLSLNAIVGYEHAVKLLNSKKLVHKFVTNE